MAQHWLTVCARILIDPDTTTAQHLKERHNMFNITQRFIQTLALAALFTIPLVPLQPVMAFDIDGGSDYAILFEGAGGNQMSVTNVTVNGNIGIGNTGTYTDSGPSTVSGRVDFSDTVTSRFQSNNSANTYDGGQSSPPYVGTFGVAAVTTALNNLTALNTTLGAESGTNVAIGTGGGQTLTVNASVGIIHGSDSVFNVTAFNTTNGNTLTIVGDGVHSVVLNIGFSVNFNNQVSLVGLTGDQVLYNFVGGNNLTGGPTLQINDNGHNHPENLVQGDFLDPNGAISVTNTNLLGRVFGGDTHDIQIVSGDTINTPTTVPDGGSAVALLGIALAGLEGARRLIHTKRKFRS